MTTKAESEHLDAVARTGCIVCWRQGIEDSPATCHHIRVQTGAARKESNWRVLPLCPAHHQDGDGTETFRGELGYHRAPETWEARYGTQESLLCTQIVYRMGLPWDSKYGPAPSKVVPRR